MRVGIAAPLSIAAVTGGIRTQVTETVRELRNLGVEVDFISLEQTRFQYDLVHVFSAGPDTLGIAKQVKDTGTKLVVSPVFFSTRSARAITLSLKAEKLLGFLGSGIRSDFGIKAQICSWADLLLPNTRPELELVRDGLGIDAGKITVVPNGVETRFANADATLFMETYFKRDVVLFAGQAGALRKNVKLLLEAAPRIEAQIVIIGDFYDNDYSRECLQLVQKLNNVILIETQDHDSPLLESAYAAAKVFVLPSTFETPGIAAMEAALAGAQVVITERGGTRDYFANFVEYINPNSVDELIGSINKSIEKKNSSALKNHILENYTWPKVAALTLASYKKLS